MFYSFRVAAWPVSQRIPFLFDLSSLLQRGNYIFSIWRVSALFAFRVCVISFISSIYPPVVSVDYSFCSLNAHSVLSPCIFPSFLPSFSLLDVLIPMIHLPILLRLSIGSSALCILSGCRLSQPFLYSGPRHLCLLVSFLLLHISLCLCLILLESIIGLYTL